jgi:uncharacterized protein YeaO (DUF488 family)
LVKLKRIYEKPLKEDGFRILVERLWPRGFTKERASIDLWMKDIAPSSELRKWFGHDPEKWEEFCKLYHAELIGRKDLVDSLKQKSKERAVTLIYSSRDERHNSAVALKMFLKITGKTAGKS